jgi:hypothetical protein
VGGTIRDGIDAGMIAIEDTARAGGFTTWLGVGVAAVVIWFVFFRRRR